MEFAREAHPGRPVEERVKDWKEVYKALPEDRLRTQGARCMDCGVPFCHTGCPINNIIPDWNDLVYQDRWEDALRELHSTNNFPEFTGRICPAPCESACVLGINEPPVAIKSIERAIADKGWEMGWIAPEPPSERTGKSVAVIGSGPAGLAAAQQLNRAGHSVTVYEKNEVAGGLLVLGIPDFKMEKHVVQRRIDQMEAEGVEFVYNTLVGVDVKGEDLLRDFDAVLIAAGSEKPRDLPIPGRDLDGIHFAMDFLPQQNRRNGGRTPDPKFDHISAKDKHVIIIGGGDTGADCLGTSRRQGAKSIRQYELLPKPPESRDQPGSQPWPLWPFTFKVESSHEEGDVREYAINTKEFLGEGGKVTALKGVDLEWKPVDPATGRRAGFEEVAESEFEVPADLVLLAMGFVHPVHEGMVDEFGLDKDKRGNILANMNDFATSHPKVFAAGDCRRGQSLVVWAIAEGRKAAHAVDASLMGSSSLPLH